MKKLVLIVVAFIFALNLKSQSPLTLSITSNSGAFSITCEYPSITITPSSNYTAGVIIYTLNAITYTAIGSNFNITVAGNYTVTAFVNNNLNVTQTISIGSNTIIPTSTVTPLSQLITCTNTAIQTITASTSAAINALHQFMSPFGGTTSINSTIVYYLPGPGTHTHVLTNLLNGCKVTKTFSVNYASGFPTYSIVSSQNFSLGCETKSITSISIINGITSPPGGTLTYTLLTPQAINSSTSSSQNVYTVSVPGNYTVIVKDQLTGCESKVPVTVIQNTINPSVSAIIPTQTLNCNVTQAILQANSNAQTASYSWFFPMAPGTSTGNVITVLTSNNLTNSIIATYTLSVTDNNNMCMSSSVIPMYQNVYPPNALIYNNAANSITSCTTPSITLINQSNSGIPINSVFSSSLAVIGLSWSGPSPQQPASNTQSYTAYTIGVYNLTVKDLNNGCNATTSISLSDNRNYPQINNPSGPPAFCLDPPTNTISIYPIITGNTAGFTYFWSSPPIASAPAVTSPTLTTNSLGIYTISVTNPSNGCKSVGQVTVVVCTAINNKEDAITHFGIYPNPNNGIFNLTSDNDLKTIDIQIYNSLGSLVHVQTLNSKNEVINLKNESKGIYFLRVIKNDQIISTLKLVNQ